ncbi:serine hydrolase [Aliidiomarina soli]|uniref:Beta-lactamase n=1 Tax=Aliidiomarina soli TaxID=1928574 RepID=A0A432WF61_9GAMM|nr:serine hydrolase [Aliidiomarina soli]RUO32347.1 hypothetical protein CWE14_09355 [Aliidiomarina soli]
MYPRRYPRRKTIAVMAGLVAGLLSLMGSANGADISTAVEARIEGDSSGGCLAVGRLQVIEDGADIRRETAFACADNDTSRADARTVFEIGSISKAMLGVLAADLVLRGDLDIDRPVADYLPHAGPPDTADTILVRHLLTHTSGLPRLPALQPADHEDPYADFTDDALWRSFENAPLASEPGEAYSYSNFAYMILSKLIAEVSGQSVQDYYQTRLFEPLAMEHSGFGVETIEGRLANGDAAKNWNFPKDMEAVGGVRSSLHDMLNFAQLQLGLGPSELVEAAQQSHQLLAEVGEQRIAWGWMLHERNNRQYIMHGGGTGGFNATLIIEPAEQKAVVVLANAALYNTQDVQSLGLHLLDDSVEPGLAHRVAARPEAISLEDYEGDYPLVPGFNVRIFAEDNQLYLQVSGQPSAPLNYQSEDVFENLQYGVEIEFERDETGQVSGLELRQYGQTLSGPRDVADGNANP